MAIVISTNDSNTGLKQESYATHSEARQVKPEPAKTAAQTNESIEENTEESATPEKEKVDNSLSYLEDSDDTTDEDASEEDGDLDTEDTEEEEKPAKNGFQKRINKLTKEKSELSKKLADLEEKVNALSGQKPQENKPSEKIEELKEPVESEYQDYAEYLKAKAKYEIKQEMAQEKLAQEKAKLDAESKKVLDTFRERVKKAESKYGDKWTEMAKNEPQYTLTVRQEILSSEVGPEIILYLYTNKEELNKINDMTPSQQIKAVGKIEEKINQVLTKRNTNTKISTAPEPIKTINGKATSGNKKPEEMPLAEFRQFREKSKK